MRKWLFGLLIIIVIFTGFWLAKIQFNFNWPANALINFGKNMETTKICFNKNCFVAEVARTQTQRAKGLMYRESLALDAAMFFVFSDIGFHNFWMKNCLIPLDIIWLDENYKIVAVVPNNQPCPQTGDCPSIMPGVAAKYALEINAGLADKIGLAEGSYFTSPEKI